MAYESFTLALLEQRFTLTYRQTEDAFGSLAPIEPSDFLRTAVARGLPLVVGKTSEKARSEVLVMPVLLEVREIRGRQVAIFSGVKFDVDRKSGLFGYCDFLITRDPMVDDIRAPVVAVAEAKKEDLNAGLPQCVAEMVATQKFNRDRDSDVRVVYGAVTDGTRWRFLQLEGATVSIDLREYPLAELARILGVLVAMVS